MAPYFRTDPNYISILMGVYRKNIEGTAYTLYRVPKVRIHSHENPNVFNFFLTCLKRYSLWEKE